MKQTYDSIKCKDQSNACSKYFENHANSNRPFGSTECGNYDIC